MSLAAIISLVNDRPFRHRQNARKMCNVDGCTVLATSRGWCGKHYQRWRIHGDPLVAQVNIGVADEVEVLIATGKMESLVCVANIVGVSRERIRQIVNRRGLSLRYSNPLEWPCPRCGIAVKTTTRALVYANRKVFCRRCSSAGDNLKRRSNRCCSIAGCERKHQAHGYCASHYSRWKRGFPMELPIRQKASCQGCRAVNCREAHSARGYCRAHYDQLRTREKTGIETELLLGDV